jgi:hypothetical protein
VDLFVKVIGIEPSLWRKLYHGKVPKQLHEFHELVANPASSSNSSSKSEESNKNDENNHKIDDSKTTSNQNAETVLRFPKSGGDLFLYTKGNLFFFFFFFSFIYFMFLFGFLYFSRKATERPNCIYCHVPNNSEQ